MAWLYHRSRIYYIGWRDRRDKCHGRRLGTRNRRVAQARQRVFECELGGEAPLPSQASP